MKVGIIGLPNIGKSSIFNLLTHAHAHVAKFPFTTIEKNIGMIKIPDTRLEDIVSIHKSKKVRYSQIEFVDIAGLIKGASQGDGLGNKFLAHIRDVDLIVHVLRCFTKEDIPHTYSEINPRRDYDIVRTELFLSDLAITERRIEKVHKKKECKEEYEKLLRIKESLVQARIPEERIEDLPLLSTKEECIVLNMDENTQADCGKINGYRLSAKIEEDIVNFSSEEQKNIRTEYNLDPRGLIGLIEICMQKLSVIIFYTIKGEEASAWPVIRGTNACDAAGMIHTDMKKGFIKAEVLNYQEFLNAHGFTQAQRMGKTRIEGKEYIVNDGDILLIKFRV